VIKAKFGDRLDGWIHAALPFLFRRRIDPNFLTLLGLAISLVASVAFAGGWLRSGGVLILVGGFFDLVDGVVARHHGTSSTFGAFLDSTLDRLVDMLLLLGILMHFAVVDRPGGVLLSGVVLVASVMTSYAKARAERYVPDFGGGVLERGERVGLLAAGAILGFLVLALWIVAIGATITVIQRFLLAHREMERLDAAARAAAAEQGG